MLLYGRGRKNVVHLGDWLIDQFPMTTPTSTSRCKSATRSAAELRSTAPSRRSSCTRQVYSARLHPLLCALTSAELVAYAEQPSEHMPDIVSGKFRSMLIDIFGRSYPEKKFFMVDRDAVTRYKARVHRNVGQVARAHRRPPAQRGGGARADAVWRFIFSASSLYSRRHQHQRSCRSWPVIPNSRTSCTRRGAPDKARSKLFGKLAREITVAAKLGMPDPAFNPRLRAAILAARAENMPKDNIERAIKKSQGSDSESYDEIRYEGYGPGGVAVIVEALTDNRNRTAGEVRAIFTKSGGNLAETGAVSFMFDHVGVVEYDAKVGERRRHAGSGDRGRRRGRHLERRRPSDFHHAGDVAGRGQGAGSKFGEPRKSALLWKPQNTVAVDDETGEKLFKLIESLDESDDVQNVYANFEVSDALVQKMSA